MFMQKVTLIGINCSLHFTSFYYIMTIFYITKIKVQYVRMRVQQLLRDDFYALCVETHLAC